MPSQIPFANETHSGVPRRLACRHHWRKLLLADGVERIIRHARKEAAGTSGEEAVEAQVGYFVHNIERMR